MDRDATVSSYMEQTRCFYKLLWPSNWVPGQHIVIINIPLLTSPAVWFVMRLSSRLAASFLLVSVFALCGKYYYSLNSYSLSLNTFTKSLENFSTHFVLHPPIAVARLFS